MDELTAARPPDGETDFDGFVAARGPALLRLCVALTGSVPEAEDLLQEALARCYVRWRRVSRVDNVEGYVRRVVVHQHISRHRKRRLRFVDDAADQPSPHDAAEGVAVRLTMAAAVEQLPPRQRVVIVLSYYEDLPDAQIAEALECSVNTVKSHRAKALAHLRVSRDVAALHDPA
jgi:RNA polymerase sigma-70 factor (sigma-E family)